MNHIPCEIAFKNGSRRVKETGRARERDMVSEINFQTINYKQ